MSYPHRAPSLRSKMQGALSFAAEYEAACRETITQAEAFDEIDRHDLGVGSKAARARFIEECGDHPTYPGQLVLDWIGY